MGLTLALQDTHTENNNVESEGGGGLTMIIDVVA
jgi:hypothetical protein